YGLDEAINRFEAFDWRERQAKYIVNSVRVYNYFGYDWWLPFWDIEFFDHWLTVPTNQRLRKALYNQYVAQAYSELAGVANSVAAITERTPAFGIGRLVAVARRAGILKIAGSIYRAMRRKLAASRSAQLKHPFAWYAIVPPDILRARSS